MTDDLEAEMDRKLLVISIGKDFSCVLEENPLPGYMLSGIASWLEMYAEAEMLEEMTEENEDD